MARKENKLRPYRVDYFNIPEMKKDRALVHSTVVRAVTAQQAQNMILWDDPTASGNGMFIEGRIVIRAYRFYKKAPAAKEVFKPVEDLFTVNKAVEVMEVVEKYRALLATPPAPVPAPAPEPVCPYGYTAHDAEIGAMTAHNCAIHTNTNQEPVDVIQMPELKIDLDTAAPIIHPAPTAVEIPNYTFPDHPVVPTQPAVFDDHRNDYMWAAAKDAVLTPTGEIDPPANVPFPGPTPLWLKLVAFGSIAFIVVSIVLVILHSTH